MQNKISGTNGLIKQYSSMLQYLLFHAAPVRNWFLRLMSHRCEKVVDWGGVHYFCRIFASFLQFGIMLWKADAKTNLMMVSK